MRVLVANKFYYRRGGADAYSINVEQMLKEKGHEVAFFSMEHPENLESDWAEYFPSEVKFSVGPQMIESFLRPLGTKEVRKKFTAIIEAFKPDVVHFNNIHSQLSPVIAEIAHEHGVKVVWTLHDYKLLCPRYDCLKNDKVVCEECFFDKRPVLKNKCMKNSGLASFLAYKEAVKWRRTRIENCVDKFICPSKFILNKMIQGGFDASKMVHLCNFIDTTRIKYKAVEEKPYYCFLGRLSLEKGLKTLIAAASKLPYKLKVIGKGPIESELKKIASENIEFVGYKNWDEIQQLLSEARFMVIPSEWYENNPLSVIESLCIGTPVLGARMGGIPELIDDSTGMTFECADVADLCKKIECMWNHPFDYKAISTKALIRFSMNAYYDSLVKIYND